MTTYPLSAVRALALHAQALDTPNGAEPAPVPDAIHDIVERLMCVQIDTLQMVHRSHYLVVWSRLGKYAPADFDKLAYNPDHRRLFEYWMHAASLIPFSLYRYRIPAMRRFRENGGHWRRDWIKDPQNRQVFEQVMARIRQEGAARTSDFDNPDRKGGTWWDWKPAKHALEIGYNCGDLMIADRVNFQRVYDLKERVLPGWVDTSEPTPAETRRHLLERAFLAMGIGEAGHAADYAYMKRGEAKPHLEALLAEGVAVSVPAELFDGQTRDLIVHRDNLPRLEQAAAGEIDAARTTFLSPFDSLFWARKRDEAFWGFRQALEAYKPAGQREWGYYCLPILHRGRLVGRFDPKLERKTGTLRLKALYLEPGIEPDEALTADVAGAMRDFMAFHEAGDLVVERSEPATFGERLTAAL
ncbi:MAG: YcaQ family DNA glycosylase [Anaerolineae bacterium]|nr:YcaQ family DNA glycosylase [Anaerolineae bacterium]